MTLRVTPSEIVDAAEASGNPGLLARAPGWPRARLGDVARVVNGAPYASSLFNKDGDGMPLVRIRDISADAPSTWYSGEWEKAHLVHRGDALVGMDGDFNLARWKNDDAVLNQRVCRLDVDASLYDARFLSLVLPGYLKAVWNRTSSTTVKHLSSRTISELPLPCPPLTEQRYLVEVLEDQLSRLDAATAYLWSARRRSSSYSNEVIRRQLVGGDNSDLAKTGCLLPAGTADGCLTALPQGWSWERLGSLAAVVGGVTKDSKKQSDPAFVEVPYLRVANVQRGRLDLESISHLRVAPSKLEALRLLPGDVLMNEGGDRDKLARGWVWDGEIDDCIHQNHVFRARVIDGRIHPKLLSWAANSIGAEWASRNGKQSVNLASISLSKIKLMPVPVPPAREQGGVVRRIEERLAFAARANDAIVKQERRTRTLRRALLTAAFSGRLTGRSTDTEVVEEIADSQGAA